MYELVKLTEKSYYINCPAKIGLYKISDSEVVLIDSGNDKEAAKKILRVLEAENWTLKAVYNTHSNADHIGGNLWLQKKTGCDIYAMPIERIFTEYPILETSFLFGGYPHKALRNKFLMAQASTCLELKAENLPPGLEIIALPGHFFEMVGFKTDDGICFLGDSIFGELIIEKYHLTFIYDVAKYLETLEMIKTIEADTFVPSHAEASTDISRLADLNIAKVREIQEKIYDMCKVGLCFEDVLKGIFDFYELTLDMNQYVLVGSTIRSFLSYLTDRGDMTYSVIDNKLIWQSH